MGKTLVARTLLHAFAAQGIVCAGYKPVSAGCTRTRRGTQSGCPAVAAGGHGCAALRRSILCLRAPRPHIAAREAGHPFAGLSAGLKKIEASGADLVIVEGAGGWLLPLDHQHLLSGVGRP